jgi:gluconokinase
MQTPCPDYKETKGLVYFARMLDKIRLKGRGELPPDYFVGVDDDPTMFDARCTRFLGVNYDELAIRALQGGSDEEILEWCFKQGRRPSEEEIKIWNAFLLKRGWRDEASCRPRNNARDWKIATTSRLGWICTTLKKEERRDSFFWLNFGCDLAPIAEALSFHHDHVVFFEDRH